MAWCELCDMDLSFCQHGLAERQARASADARLLVSPRGMAHFEGCPHKGDDPDYSLWGELQVPRAWQRLGRGERFEVVDGRGRPLSAQTRCSDCIERDGPW
jgi:hypothetical protein